MAEILGLPIPDEGPAFLVILLVHILAGLTGVVCGATAALTRKGSPAHVRFGRIYGWALVAIIATMAAMAGIGLAYIWAAYTRRRRDHQPEHPAVHHNWRCLDRMLCRR